MKMSMCLRSRIFFDLVPRSLRFHLRQHFQTASQKPLDQSVKFHVDSSWDGGTKFCSNDPGHMTIYGKTFKIFLFGTDWPMSVKLGIEHWVVE